MHALAAVKREIQPRDPARASKYLREFIQVFRAYDHPLTAEQLEDQIASAETVLVGDYHALPQSQRFTSSTLEKLANSRPVVLGVEAILSRDQRVLDSWWRREISEDELRSRLRFDREWGYDWLPFYELLTTARDRAEGIYGLDCLPRTDLRRIRSRDRHAAEKIRDIRQRHPRAVILVLFGESHMAPGHLPRALRSLLPGEKMLTVLQNVDALYWQAAADGSPPAAAVTDHVICVFNSSPLEKYESFRMCLEKWQGDDSPDFAPAVYNLIFSLAKSLGFRLGSYRAGTQPRYLADSLPEVLTVSGTAPELEQSWGLAFEAGRNLPRLIRDALEEKGCLYVPSTNTFLIREFKMVQAAAQASRFLYHACQGFPSEPIPSPLESALARFASCLLCPGLAEETSEANVSGDEFYRAYLDGRLSKPALRKMFLSNRHSEQQPALL